MFYMDKHVSFVSIGSLQSEAARLSMLFSCTGAGPWGWASGWGMEFLMQPLTLIQVRRRRVVKETVPFRTKESFPLSGKNGRYKSISHRTLRVIAKVPENENGKNLRV